MIGSFVALLLLLFGVGFLVVAALGLVRMEDVYTRLHAASKAAPFGATFVLIGVAVASGSVDVWVRAVVICAFLLLTAPIAGHVIGRAAYLERVRTDATGPDALAGKYDAETLTLHSADRSDLSNTRDEDGSTPQR